MEFLKKHYEKFLLGVVLFGLTIGLGFLPFKIATERAELEEKRQQVLTVRPEALKALELARTDEVLLRLKSPVRFEFSGLHNLFNPVQWQKRPDGSLIKVQTGREVGPAKVEVTKISPLYMTVSFESVGASGSNYLVTIKREAETDRRRATTSRYLELDEKIDSFSLREIKGPANKPTELVFESSDTGERVAVAPDNPYKRVDGYTVDLKYDPENRRWTNQRIGSLLRGIGGDDYTIVSINAVASDEYEIVLSAKPTGKKTTIRYKLGP